MKHLSIYEGKNKFSEVIANAAKGEPQIITKNGKETAVVISIAEYRRMHSKEESFGEFLRNSPLYDSGIDLTRSKDMGRPALDFSEE
jgi:prevent-host-death family protein